jgi:hypothetical protein
MLLLRSRKRRTCHPGRRAPLDASLRLSNDWPVCRGREATVGSTGLLDCIERVHFGRINLPCIRFGEAELSTVAVYYSTRQLGEFTAQQDHPCPGRGRPHR